MVSLYIQGFCKPGCLSARPTAIHSPFIGYARGTSESMLPGKQRRLEMGKERAVSVDRTSPCRTLVFSASEYYKRNGTGTLCMLSLPVTLRM
jgi:hypothetical protein